MKQPRPRRPFGVIPLRWAALAMLAPRAGAQESFTIVGTVLDATTREPLQNVSVVLEGTGLGRVHRRGPHHRLAPRPPAGVRQLPGPVLG